MSTKSKSPAIQALEQRQYEMAVMFIEQVKKNNDDNYLVKELPMRWDNGSFVTRVTHVSQRMVTVLEAMHRLHGSHVSMFPKGDYVDILL